MSKDTFLFSSSYAAGFLLGVTISTVCRVFARSEATQNFVVPSLDMNVRTSMRRLKFVRGAENGMGGETGTGTAA